MTYELTFELGGASQNVENEVKAREEIKEQYAASERRAMGLSGELEELRTHMEAAERSRKAAEGELHEASDRVAELTNANSSLATQKRKLENDIQAMHVRPVYRLLPAPHLHRNSVFGPHRVHCIDAATYCDRCHT